VPAALDEVPALLSSMDVVFSATRAPAPLVSAATVRQAMGARTSRALRMIDLALPRDIDPEAGTIPGVTLRAIDSIQSVVGRGLEQRAAQVPTVERIVDDECQRFGVWWRGLEATPVVVALRDHFERIRLEELQRLGSVPEAERQRADRLTKALINRLLHVPTLRLKTDAASDAGHQRLAAAQELFALRQATRRPTRPHDG
jgi:glutamyl-tRNA reductase